MDYAVPISFHLTKSGDKCTIRDYIAIWICMCTRAVTLEAVEDCSSETFIVSAHRFIARRGHCTDLHPGNGTNFVGAHSDLRELFNEASFHVQQTTFTLVQHGTTWRFNPARVVPFGGLWESAAKSAKHHLRRVIDDQVLTFVELSNLLCRVEACLSSRPL